VLAVGIFADGTYGGGWNGISGNVTGILYSGTGWGQLAAQIMHVVIGFAWAWGVTWIIFVIAKNFMQIRVSPEAELEGLDVPEFGVLCYPDFVLHHASVGHVTTGAEEIDVTATTGVSS
jgi:Amt family ammonium transporter